MFENLFLLLDIYPCDNVGVLNVFYFIKQLIKIIFIIVPAGSIIMLSYDLFKNVISNDEGSQRKNLAIFIRRIIILVIVFLVPYIVDFVVNFIDNNLNNDSNNYLKCFNVSMDTINNQLKKDESSCKSAGGKWVASTRSCSGVDDYKAYYNDSSSNSKKNSSSKSGKTGFVKEGNKTYYYKNGKKLTGRQKIGGSYYYFSKKNGAMKTGLLKINKSFYYYKKKNGKQAFGTVKFKGPYNGTNKKDTWYFNKKSGKLEGVKLNVVKQYQQGMCGCGPTSVAMILTYVSGKNISECYVECGGRSNCICSDGGNCPAGNTYELYSLNNTNLKTKFGYKLGERSGAFSPSKSTVLEELFSGRPFVFQAPPTSDNPRATEERFTAGSGHYLVVSGYHNGRFIFKNPSNDSMVQNATWSTIQAVKAPSDAPYTSFHFLKKIK